MRRFAMLAAVAVALSAGTMICPAVPRPAAIGWARPVITGTVIVGALAGSIRTIASAGAAIAATTDRQEFAMAIAISLAQYLADHGVKYDVVEQSTDGDCPGERQDQPHPAPASRQSGPAQGRPWLRSRGVASLRSCPVRSNSRAARPRRRHGQRGADRSAISRLRAGCRACARARLMD